VRRHVDARNFPCVRGVVVGIGAVYFGSKTAGCDNEILPRDRFLVAINQACQRMWPLQRDHVILRNRLDAAVKVLESRLVAERVAARCGEGGNSAKAGGNRSSPGTSCASSGMSWETEQRAESRAGFFCGESRPEDLEAELAKACDELKKAVSRAGLWRRDLANLILVRELVAHCCHPSAWIVCKRDWVVEQRENGGEGGRFLALWNSLTGLLVGVFKGGFGLRCFPCFPAEGTLSSVWSAAITTVQNYFAL